MIGPSHPAFKTPQKIVAFSGYARAGKDEAAKVLVEEYGYERRGFADKLREVLYALNPLVDVQGVMTNSLDYDAKIITVQDVINAVGWNGYKETAYGPEIRRLLQRLGTEAGREILGNNIWVDALFNEEYDQLVIPDCRFPNEYQGVKDRGGYVIRIERQGVTAVNAHISETALDDYKFDAVIRNDGGLENLKEKIMDWTSTHA